MAVYVPTDVQDNPRWTQRTALDGAEYVLTFAWNARLGLWFLDLADPHADPIASGMALTTSWPLLAHYAVRDARRPSGDLVVVDTIGGVTDPTYSSLGMRHVLVYATAAEWAAL